MGRMKEAETEQKEQEAAALGRGSQPVAATTVAHVRYPSGAVGRIAVTGELGDLAGGAVVIGQAEYEAELARLEAGHAEHLAELTAADEANTLSDYRDLRAAGVSDAGARRMSGYTGPTVEGAP